MALEYESSITFKTITVEFLATLLLIFTGCGATIAVTKENEGLLNLQIALAWGFAYATLTQTFSHLSGAHMNPAITLAFLVTRKMSLRLAVVYIITQLSASITGAAILDSVSGQKRFATLGVTQIARRRLWHGVHHHLCDSALLVLAHRLANPLPGRGAREHIALWRHHRPRPPHCGTVWPAALFSPAQLPFTGCSINPARSFGPAVITNTWDAHWVFWLGPLAGGVLGGLLHALWFAGGAAKLSLHEVFGLKSSGAAQEGRPSNV